MGKDQARLGHGDESSLYGSGLQRIGRALAWFWICLYAAIIIADWVFLARHGIISAIAVTAFLLRRMSPHLFGLLAERGKSGHLQQRLVARYLYAYTATFGFILLAWGLGERHNPIGGVAAVAGLAGSLLTLLWSAAAAKRDSPFGS